MMTMMIKKSMMIFMMIMMVVGTVAVMTIKDFWHLPYLKKIKRPPSLLTSQTFSRLPSAITP